jgi:MoxR-like ATPase
MEILELRKDAIYFDASNTTNRILDVLEEKRPKIILIDELDKMGKSWQNQLLNFMGSGKVKVDQQKRQYDFEIKGAKVFATANDISRLSKALQSMFRKLFLPRYSEAQFLEVSEKVLPKTSHSSTLGLPCGRVKGILGMLLVSGNWFASQTDLER